MRRGIFLLCCLALGGCATGRTNTRVVFAAGAAPIVNNDIAGARKASLDDALKNALGLVNGVYVAQESLVSKVLLVEDTILTQTRGFIARYKILRESRENGFYQTAIKAEIRKDNLSALLKTPAAEPQLGAISVRINIDETVDGSPFSFRSAQDALKIRFTRAGFNVTESSNADIVISGKAAATLATGTAINGFISYRTVLSLTALRSGCTDALAVAQETEGGVDITREAAANASLVNAANAAARDLTGSISRAVQEHSVIRLTLSNVNSMACLNSILRSLRSLDEVKECRVRTYTGCNAQVDLESRRGAAFDIARHLERLTTVKIIINQAKPEDIQAICIFSDYY